MYASKSGLVNFEVVEFKDCIFDSCGQYLANFSRLPSSYKVIQLYDPSSITIGYNLYSVNPIELTKRTMFLIKSKDQGLVSFSTKQTNISDYYLDTLKMITPGLNNRLLFRPLFDCIVNRTIRINKTYNFDGTFSLTVKIGLTFLTETIYVKGR